METLAATESAPIPYLTEIDSMYSEIALSSRMEKTRMNIDERLEKLAERHEALTGSVEILTLEVRDLRETVNSLSGSVKSLTDSMGELREFSGTIARAILNHEDRIRDLETGNAA